MKVTFIVLFLITKPTADADDKDISRTDDRGQNSSHLLNILQQPKKETLRKKPKPDVKIIDNFLWLQGESHIEVRATITSKHAVNVSWDFRYSKDLDVIVPAIQRNPGY